MHLANHFTRLLLALTFLAACSSVSFSSDPGNRPAANLVTDQQAGSVLFYNLYASSATNSTIENTRINLTNTSPNTSITIHLFFVDGKTCTPADSYFCLSKSQTVTILASDVDPGVTGYILAVAVDTITGCPISFNHLIGDAYVKLASGHKGNLGAEALVAEFSDTDGDMLPGCDETLTEVGLTFGGGFYNPVPRVLAVDNIASPGEGNSTLLVVNSTGGNLSTGESTFVGTLFGIMFDAAENPYSFSIPGPGCQVRGVISDSFPRTVPRFSKIVPPGQTGWLKFWTINGFGIFGAALNYNPNEKNQSSAFNGGHNLHKLTTTEDTVIIPLFPPNCRN